jgi:hypothetical protein
MPTRFRARGPVPGRRSTGRLAVPVAVLTLLLGDVLVQRPGYASAGTSPADVMSDVVEGYASRSLPGVVATVVARQHSPGADLSPSAADALTSRTDDAWADNGRAAARPFPTASLVKLFIAEDVLHRVRTGRLELRPGDRRLLQRMISGSDDPAASALWVRYNGERMVRTVARRYGLTGTTPPAVPGQWGQTTTTARDLARFLTRLPVVAHPDDAATLLGWMRAVTPTAADGFDQRYGMFGAGADPAVKQGWMCCVGGDRHVHSVGVVGRTVVVLLAEVPERVGYTPVREALTAAAEQVPPAGRP